VAGSVHLHSTDADGEWVVTEPDPSSRLAVTHEHAKGDAAVRGSASDLLLLLWRRLNLDDHAERFEVFGDRAVVDRLLARNDLG
jgi:predicted lipid carrier protein YhbT